MLAGKLDSRGYPQRIPKAISEQKFKSKDQATQEIISSKRITQFDWKIKLLSENSTTKLFSYLKSLNEFVVSMEAYPYAKSQYHNSIPF